MKNLHKAIIFDQFCICCLCQKVNFKESLHTWTRIAKCVLFVFDYIPSDTWNSEQEIFSLSKQASLMKDEFLIITLCLITYGTRYTVILVYFIMVQSTCRFLNIFKLLCSPGLLLLLLICLDCLLPFLWG